MNVDLNAEIKHLQERYDKAPESRIFAPLADACRKNGDVDRAIELCEAGLERYPDYASAHVILGKCFYDKGATERSRAEFERVIEIDPENTVAEKNDQFLGVNNNVASKTIDIGSTDLLGKNIARTVCSILPIIIAAIIIAILIILWKKRGMFRS